MKCVKSWHVTDKCFLTRWSRCCFDKVMAPWIVFLKKNTLISFCKLQNSIQHFNAIISRHVMWSVRVFPVSAWVFPGSFWVLQLPSQQFKIMNVKWNGNSPLSGSLWVQMVVCLYVTLRWTGNSSTVSPCLGPVWPRLCDPELGKKKRVRKILSHCHIFNTKKQKFVLRLYQLWAAVIDY